VLDEAEIDNSSAVDCGEDYSPDNILDSLSDNKDNVDAEMKELPDQLTENEVSRGPCKYNKCLGTRRCYFGIIQYRMCLEYGFCFTLAALVSYQRYKG